MLKPTRLRRWAWLACACLVAPLALAQTTTPSPNLNAIRALAKALAPTIELPVEQPQYGAAVPVRVHAPASVGAKRYLVEIEAWSGLTQSWSPAGQLSVMPAPDGSGQLTLEANWFAQHAADAAKGRLRARVDDPRGPWSDWRSFSRTTAAARTAAVATAASSVLKKRSATVGESRVAPDRVSSVAAKQGVQTGSGLPGSAILSSGNSNQETEFQAQVRRLRVGPGQQSIRVKVWNGIQPLDFRTYIDGPIDVNWRREKLQWWFKFDNRGSEVRRGPLLLRWELSLAPFPAWGDWKPIPGFALTGTVEKKGDQQNEFMVDLAALAPRPPDWAVTHPPTLFKSQQPDGGGTAAPNPGLFRKAPASPASSLPADAGVPRESGLEHRARTASVLTRAERSTAAATTSASSGLVVVATNPAFSSQPVAPLLLSLYLRVVPVDASGKPVGRPSNAVELHFGELEKQPGFKFKFDPPTVTFAGYRAVQPYSADWQCWVIANASVEVMNVTVASKGDHKNLCEPKDSSLLDDFVDTFGSFIDFFKGFVNWVSNAYASIKSGVISAVASAIGCSDNPPCMDALEMGLNAGLAALGMPPELPDFDQLEAMGEGYLVEVIAQQAAQTGFPGADIAAQEAAKAMIEQGKQAMSSGGGGSGPWVPDPAKQYKPLQLVVEVSNNLPTPTTAVNMRVTETTSNRYMPRTVPIPSLAPGKNFKIAVALEPTADPRAWMDLLPTVSDMNLFDMSNYNAKKAKAETALAEWRETYTTGFLLEFKVDMRPQFDASTGLTKPLTKSCSPDKSQCLVN